MTATRPHHSCPRRVALGTSTNTDNIQSRHVDLEDQRDQTYLSELSELVEVYKPTHILRSSSVSLLAVHILLFTTGARSFRYVAASILNALSDIIRSLN